MVNMLGFLISKWHLNNIVGARCTCPCRLKRFITLEMGLRKKRIIRPTKGMVFANIEQGHVRRAPCILSYVCFLRFFPNYGYLVTFSQVHEAVGEVDLGE